MKIALKLLLLILGLITAGTVFPNTASALTLTPTRFELKSDPGQTLSEIIKLINETDKTQTLYVTFANFEAQGESGTPTFVEPKEGLGTWISTSADSYTISPGQQINVPITIRVPSNAQSGGHFAVVFFGTSPGSGGDVSIGAKTGALILLSVNGELREQAGLFDYGVDGGKFFHKTLPVTLSYRFKNDGNDRVKPQGDIVVRNMLFLPTEKLNANPVEGNVLPASTRKFEITWIEHERPLNFIPKENFFGRFWDEVVYEWKNFAFGFYIANLNIAYGSQSEKVSDIAFFFVFPWELSIVMLIVLLIVYFGGRTIIRRYNKYIIAKARAQM